MAARGTANVRVRAERIRGKKQPVVISTIAKHRQRRYTTTVKQLRSSDEFSDSTGVTERSIII
jgi:hypothetical protein